MEALAMGGNAAFFVTFFDVSPTRLRVRLRVRVRHRVRTRVRQ